MSKVVNIIVADDIAEHRKQILSKLKGLRGVQVEEVSRISDISLVMARVEPDFLLLDIKWASSDRAGLNALFDISKNPIYEKTKILAMSFDPNLLKNAVEYGAYLAIEKKNVFRDIDKLMSGFVQIQESKIYDDKRTESVGRFLTHFLVLFIGFFALTFIVKQWGLDSSSLFATLLVVAIIAIIALSAVGIFTQEIVIRLIEGLIKIFKP